MGRIRSVAVAALLLFSIIILTASTTAERTAEFEKMNEMYRKVYPYMTYKDTVYTFESEFIYPEGYSRPDSSKLSEFSNWVARMPIWYAYKSIGNWKGMKIKDYTEVSRAVHIPWKGPTYRDHAFPIRILAEYFVYKNNYNGFSFIPQKGEKITYDIWLSGKPAKRSGGEIFFQSDFARDTSIVEYYNFMSYTLTTMNYSSLIKNCESIKEKDLIPGDMYIVSDSTGRKGKAVFIQNKIINDKNVALYIIAHSGKEACDFHIPLINKDKDNPWLTVSEIIEYVGGNDIKGFYRFKIIKD